MEDAVTGARTRFKPAKLPHGKWRVVAEFEEAGNRYVLLVDTSPTPLSSLTKRELDVLTRAAKGAATKTIASDLGLSPSTVRVLVARVCAKLGATSRASAVELYRAHTGRNALT